MERRRLQLANSTIVEAGGGEAINLTFYTEKVGEHDVCYGDFDELKNTLISIAKQYGEIYEHEYEGYVEYYVDYAPSFGVNISIDDEAVESFSAYEYENGYVEGCLILMNTEAYVYSKCIYKPSVATRFFCVLVSKLLDDGTQEIFATHYNGTSGYNIYICFATADPILFRGSITNPFASGYKAITGLSETEDGEPSVSIFKTYNKNQYFVTFDNQ